MLYTYVKKYGLHTYVLEFFFGIFQRYRESVHGIIVQPLYNVDVLFIYLFFNINFLIRRFCYFNRRYRFKKFREEWRTVFTRCEREKMESSFFRTDT